MLGAYPESQSLQYFKKGFEDAFEPESCARKFANVFEALVSQAVTPLRAHQYGLEHRPGMGWRSQDLVLFVLDPASTSDLVDLWNLRAWGVRCLQFPLFSEPKIAVAVAVWLRTASSFGNPDRKMRHQTTLLKARSLRRQDLEHCAAQLQPRPSNSLVLQDWMPRLWRAGARAYDVNERGELLGDHDDLDVIVEDCRIRFDLLEPRFDTSSGRLGLPCWANTVALRDYSSTETGLVYPRDHAGLARLFRTFDHRGLQSLRFGIAVVSTGFDVSQHWAIPDGLAVVQDWFAAQKAELRPSAAGEDSRRGRPGSWRASWPSNCRLGRIARLPRESLGRRTHPAARTPRTAQARGGTS